MKRCPECRRDYFDDSLLYCLDDGNALLERADDLTIAVELCRRAQQQLGDKDAAFAEL